MSLEDDLKAEVRQIYADKWSRRDGRKVPEDTDVTAGNDAVDIEVALLYTDLSESTKLVDNFKDWFAAENYKTFLRCATKIIRNEGGHIRSFDGDRVMGIFIGNAKCTQAVRAGLKINWAVKEIIMPALKRERPNTKYVMKHVTGIDRSNQMAIKAGIREWNDLAWIGRAANHAAKLTTLSDTYATWITDKVYDVMADEAKFSNGTNMWEERKWTVQYNRRIYRSKYKWKVS